jgi:hypothetical protein
VSTIETRPLPTDYTWSFPGSPIQIRLRLSTVNDLQTVLDGRQRSRGIETPACGILRGSNPRPGVTEISGFEALSSLHLTELEERCKRESDIVGFYRTTDKGDLRMSEQDLRLAHSHFSLPGSVFLLIETDETGSSNAAFFFWDEGRIHGDFALMEFPFDAYQLAATEQRRTELAKAIDPEVRPVIAPSRRTRLGVRVAGIALLGVVLAGAIFGGLRFTRGQRATTPLPVENTAATPPATGLGVLGLSLDQQGSNLRVYWNRESPLILSANFGMVVIREGSKSRNVPLSPDQLRSGSILYAPTTDQMEIELNVVAGERVSRESITALLPPRGSENPVIASAQSVPPPRQREATADETEATAAPEKPALRKFSLPVSSRRVAPAALSAISEPPPAVNLNLGVGAPPAAVALQPSALPAPRPTAPAPAPAAPSQAPTAPALSTVDANAYTMPEPPVAVRKVAPRFLPELRYVLTGPTSVQVLVKIDSAGKVTNVTQVGNQKVHSLLLQASLDAARAWTFRPATIRGMPVAGEMILKFDFAPTR